MKMRHIGYAVLLLLFVFWLTFDFRPPGLAFIAAPLLLGALFSFPFTFIYGLSTLFTGKVKLSRNLVIEGGTSYFIGALLCMSGLLIGFGMFGLPILFTRQYINSELYKKLYELFPKIGTLLLIISVFVVLKNIITLRRARSSVALQ